MEFPKVQIAIRVLEVTDRRSYGMDRSFLNKIKPGDLIMFEADWEYCFYGKDKGTIKIIHVPSGETKEYSSSTIVNYIFNRITKFEQIGLI